MLKIENLRVNYGQGDILCGVDIDIAKGETLAVIGESGAGKTTLGLALMRLAEGRVSGRITFDGIDLLSLPEKDMNDLRGRHIAMAFQNADHALNPVLSVIDQVAEPVRAHFPVGKSEARDRAVGMLERCGVDPAKFKAYPHQLSGGEQQRVLIAMALVNDPELLILDEPVSSLDAQSRAEVIELLKSAVGNRVSIVVTHDISAAARLADKVATLYAGHVMEMGPARQVFGEPRHPYTRALLRSYPEMATGKDLQGIKGQLLRPVLGCPFHPRCTQAIDVCANVPPPAVTVDDRRLLCHRGGIVTLLGASGLSKSFKGTKAVDGVGIDIKSGETVALVGQSGSGKTTLARCIMGLERADAGEVYLEGVKVDSRDKDFYKQVQMIYQNPGESISHRMTVREAVREPLDIQGGGDVGERERRVMRALAEVQLPATEEFADTYPHHLSGGETQRVAIARALVLEPKLIIADEPTAFLDPGVQAKILKLLLDLQERHGLSILFITHDIAVARKVSDRVAVMSQGRIVEEGPAVRVLSSPSHPYTRSLLAAVTGLQSENQSIQH